MKPTGPPTTKPSGRSSRKRLWVGAGAGAAVAVLLGAVALNNAENTRDAATGATSAAAGGVSVHSAGGSAVGEVGPKLTAAALDGQQVQLPAGRPTALFFFAGWCASCVPEAVALRKLQEQHGEDVQIVAVDIDPGDTPETIKEFMSVVGDPAYPVVHDTDGSLRAAFNVNALDVTIITDADGKIVYRDSEPSSDEQLREGLRRAGVQA